MADNTLSPFWTNDGCDPQNCEHFKAWLEAQRNQDLSTNNPQEMVVTMDNSNIEPLDPPQVVDQAPTEAIEDPNRDSKGKFVEGNKASEGNKGGRPCKFCENKDEYMKIINDFYTRFKKGTEDKAVMPFFEELALDMDVDDETVNIWARKLKKDENGNLTDELEHPDFSATYYKINTLQKWRLQQRLMGRYNPTGAIKLLEWNHGKMSTSKQVLAGDKNEPLQIEIIEEGKQIDAE